MLVNLEIDNTYINPDYIVSLTLLQSDTFKDKSEWIIAANMINGKIMTLRTFHDFQEAEVFLSRLIEETNNISRGK